MMQVNGQHVFDEQKENFGHFNELKTLILGMIPRTQDCKYLPGQKTGGGAGASIREGASIWIKTVHMVYNNVHSCCGMYIPLCDHFGLAHQM